MVKTRRQIQQELDDASLNAGESAQLETDSVDRECYGTAHSLLSSEEPYMRPPLEGLKNTHSGDGVSHARHSTRDAARRALSNLRETMELLEESETSNSMQFNFRHHPEIIEELPGFKEAEEESLLSSSETAVKRSTVVSASQLASKKSNGDFTTLKRARSADTVSSISDVSLRQREESSSSESLSSFSSASDEDEPENSKDLHRKARESAKDSVDRNIDINHYMFDAVGQKSEEELVKKRIDRRYRHLFYADKHEKNKEKENSSSGLGDVSPLSVDLDISFDSVGGLPHHIVMLREMVLFPLLYSNVLEQLNLRPPRGVLFVGPPGTGKTLMARALASEGSRLGPPKITFYMRKGADILSKWVGESERQLSLLFEEAKKNKPSIIFFDEIDGLAPVRHSKTEQSHAALVATFLALMDGLEDRGQVVVIGATNRPDTVDPALRRPGRFDREFVFPYPNKAARKHVLSILTADMFGDGDSKSNKDSVVNDLVVMTEGFSGADLKALCTEAGLNRLRSSFPQLYTTSKKLVVPPISEFTVTKEDFFVAARRVQSSASRMSRESQFVSVEEHWNYLLQDVRESILNQLSILWPTAKRVSKEEFLDCGDLGAAVHQLTTFPVPSQKHSFLLLVESEISDTVACLAAFSVARSFSSLKHIVVDMLHIQVDFTYVGYSTEPVDSFRAGHMFELVQYIKHTEPSIVVLRGFDEWLVQENFVSREGESQVVGNSEAVRAWVYYMGLLARTEVLFIIPSSCLNRSKISAFFQECRNNASSWSAVEHVKTVEVPMRLTRDSLYAFMEYILRIFLVSLLHREGIESPAVLQEDTSPVPPPVEPKRETPTNSDETLKLWRKVEYRRLQLRHILSKWITQYYTSGKYKILYSADLDFTPDDPLLRAWQRHTVKSRIGLNDILQKVECHKYACLSQFHDDIDLLVRNVRTFFRSRSPNDAKYRLKALDLKENTVLNLYKINRNVVRFCEEYKDLKEPPVSDGECGDSGGHDKERLNSPLQFRSAKSLNQKARKVMWGSRRRRRNKKCRRETAAEYREENVDEEVSEGLEKLGEELSAAQVEVANHPQEKTDEPVNPSCLTGHNEHLDSLVNKLSSCNLVELDRLFHQLMEGLQCHLAAEKKGPLSSAVTASDVIKVLEGLVVLCLVQRP